MEYCSTIKRNTCESALMRRVSLEPTPQSEASQKEKDKYRLLTHIYMGFPGDSDAKESTHRWETWVGSLSWEDPLMKARQPMPAFLPGESPRTEETRRLQSLGWQKGRREWAAKHTTQRGI